MVFAFLLFIPIVVGGVGYIVSHYMTKNSTHTSTGVTWKEGLVQIVVQMAIAGISATIIYNANTGDIEIWSGSVTKKEQVRVSCSHSYECNCRQESYSCGSGKNRRTCYRRVCQTCYEHSNDWDWRVYDSVGQTFNISRVDRRGSNQPPRWTDVKIGEPTASRHRYENYLKAAPGNLFLEHGQVQQYAKILPAYPGSVYDYYRLNRLVLVNGAKVDDNRAWHHELSEINSELGPTKQANMILVLAKGVPSDFYYALRDKWVGGKKNDVILVVGVDSENTPKWARVMAWTSDKLIEVKLRDAIMDLPKLTQHETMAVIHDNVSKHFHRKPMKDFEYLAASITPTPTQWAVSMAIGVLLSIILTVIFHFKDPFGDDMKHRYRNYRRY